MKTLPEWSHLNLSEEVLITSQYLFCISRSERVYLTIEALTFSICETATRQLWLFPVGSFLSSYLLFPLLLLFSYFLCCFFTSFLPFSSSFSSQSSPFSSNLLNSSLILCFFPSSPLFLEAWPPYTPWNTVGPWCIATAQGIELVAL